MPYPALCLKTAALTELLPDWQDKTPPAFQPVTKDEFWLMRKHAHLRLPTPPGLRNSGNHIISLSQLCQWLATQAEQLGVNVFPGFAASSVLYDDQQRVIGVQTGDMGLDRNHQPSERFQPGLQLLAKHTIFAEGCRGALSQQLIAKYQLNANRDPQTYGIGVKEVWQVSADQHQPGKVIHSVGWPLDNCIYGGGFIYHASERQVALGIIIGLDYQNPYLDPFAELQRFKTHPSVQPILTGGECIQYGARAINEGGWQSLPKMSFPGGLLIGCSAGLVNVGKIKGNHNAIRSGILAAETIFSESLTASGVELTHFTDAIKQSVIGQELFSVRNIRPAFHRGLWRGLCFSALDQWVFRGKAPWTLRNHADHTQLKPAKQFAPIPYPKPDGKITFDKLTQVYLSGTRHEENQPCHLTLKDKTVPTQVNLVQYAGPEQHYCPAGVYEYIEKNGQPQLQINAANCVHCKTCDIKDPTQNIVWVAPEGGEGPNYTLM